MTTSADVPERTRLRTQTYAGLVLAQIPRLLSSLDREPRSRSYGSLDRDHWAWKFRDFPLGMLQSSTYPLALLWAHPLPGNEYHHDDRLLGWIHGALERTVSRQRGNGAFDAFAPNEKDPGPTLGIAHGLVETMRVLGDEVPPALGEALGTAVTRACEFALDRDEQHAFISNHRALFAVAFLSAADLTGDSRFRRRAESLVESILEEQAPSGWYAEYGGPDPGYESLGIFHLATIWKRTGSPTLLQSLRRSVDFYSHFVHPDGSVGGVYGSRRTRLYFPAGFEMLRAEVPTAGAVSTFMLSHLGQGNVVVPASSDLENLPPLLYTYLEAARVGSTPLRAPEPELPCEGLNGEKWFEDAGILAVGRPRYYAIVHAKRGGVCRIHDRRTGRLAYEDAGYMVGQEKRQWTSQVEADAAADVMPAGVQCENRLTEVTQPLLTPGRFLVLRLLNLTLFRSSRLGGVIRRAVVSRLITRRRPGPFHLSREIRFEPRSVHFSDELYGKPRSPVDEVELVRSFTAIHMGSAKYFHPSDLEAIPVPNEGKRLAAGLNSAGLGRASFRLSFANESAVRLEVDRSPTA